MDSRYHSVRLDRDRCRGCTNCLMHCPTDAIRVRGDHAHIINELCIDCGACIRVCSYHAKVAMTNTLKDIQAFKHRIALPAPSLYAQFKHQPIGAILDALKEIGFQEVFEVARGADLVTRATKELLKDRRLPRPFISSACPAVTRIIQVRFPGLIPNILPLRQPMEVAAQIARREYCEKHGVAPDEVGVFFITPCAAKMTAIKNPIGQRRSSVDGAISMMEVYGSLMPLLGHRRETLTQSQATPLGILWAKTGGEAEAIGIGNAMAVDGIDNVIRVLEEIEDHKLNDLEFFEGAACVGGCVGGPLVFENNYVAKNAIRMQTEGMTKQLEEGPVNRHEVMLSERIRANESMRLDENIGTAIKKLEEMNQILSRLPGYDCGSCGSPTCRTFAEDIVRGYCTEMDCIFILKERLRVMAQQMVDLAQTRRE